MTDNINDNDETHQYICKDCGQIHELCECSIRSETVDPKMKEFNKMMKPQDIDTVLSENMLRFEIQIAMFMPKFSHAGEGIYQDTIVLIFQDNKYDKRLAIKLPRELYDNIDTCPRCYTPRANQGQQYIVINWIATQVWLLEQAHSINVDSYESYFGVEGQPFKIIEPARTDMVAFINKYTYGESPQPSRTLPDFAWPPINPETSQARPLTIQMINPTTFRVKWIVPRINNLPTEQIRTFNSAVYAGYSLLAAVQDIAHQISRWIAPADHVNEHLQGIETMLIEAMATGSSTVDFNGGMLPSLPLDTGKFNTTKEALNYLGKQLLDDPKFANTYHSHFTMTILDNLPDGLIGFPMASKIGRLLIEQLFDIKLPNNNIKFKLED